MELGAIERIKALYERLWCVFHIVSSLNIAWPRLLVRLFYARFLGAKEQCYAGGVWAQRRGFRCQQRGD